ncbi:major facilitator superfamily domain-containing protein [Absidia repens]|uniref:Major facilitator superfamily domain-containing protein n=1 Tax=Absidia repens TaxID=90262 RepID=A0A1X2I9W3_9FUNG|nr:major facilitator superfamily domain-containing protein [Absidia repens]
MKFEIPSFRSAPPPVIDDEEEKKTHDSSSNITTEKNNSESDNDSKVDTSDFQYGVKSVQATNEVWTKNHLIMAYTFIWIISFILALSSGINNTLTPYVTSSFQEHSLTATTQIISSMVSGLFVLPYAKLINVWGRPQGFALMVGSMTIGLIMMAACQNVETYCAAQVFYQVGSSTVNFTMTIFIADTTSLRNRAFMIAFVASPWIATVWAYGPAAEHILATIGFRWNFGIWAIVIPVVCTPLFGLFYFNLLKARKAGLIPKVENDRTWSQSVFHYAKEFDVIGLLLICAGLAMFLLSFNLYAKQPDQWKSPLIICFLIFGGLLIIAFGIWEKWGAPVTFIPWSLMMDRTVFFTYTMAVSLYLAWYLWDSFFYSYLIVVYRLSVSQATYITNIYTIGSTFWSIVMGIIIRYNGRLKWQALYFGVPITILGVGLMINFRQPDVNIGYIIMCQIFIAFGGGTLVICEQMTVMAVSSHQYVPAVLSMENMVINIGSAVGSTIAGAMWTGIFPLKLAKYLPTSAQGDLQTIYGSIDVQSSYPVGSAESDAINSAYSDTQRLMLITATCLYTITLISVMFWKDVDVRHLKKMKGRVF